MNLADCLTKMPNAFYYYMAESLGITLKCASDKVSKHLLEKLTDGDFLREMLSRLTPEETAALDILVFQGDDNGVGQELAHQFLNQRRKDKKVPAKQVVNGLIAKGLVYAGRYGYRDIYFVPADLRNILAALLSEGYRDKLELLSPGTQPVDLRHDHLAIYQDILTFLAYIEFQEVRVTQKRVIFKRTVEKLLSRFAVREVENPAVPSLGDYPERFELIYNYCSMRKLLVIDDEDRVRVTDLGRAWVKLDLAGKVRDVFDFWLEWYLERDKLVRRGYFLAGAAPAGAWARVDSLIPLIQELPQPWQGSLARNFGSWLLNHLIRLGIWEAGREPESRQVVVCWTDLGLGLRGAQANNNNSGLPEPEQRFYVQPNYELLIPKFLDYQLRWELELMADLVKVDQILTYKLSKESLHRALEQGLSWQEALLFLEQYSANPLPQNVRYSLEEWGRQYGRLEFMDVMLLRCADVQLAGEIKSSRKLKAYILGEVSPTHLVVPRADFQEILGLLTKEGYLPRRGIITYEGTAQGKIKGSTEGEPGRSTAGTKATKLNMLTGQGGEQGEPDYFLEVAKRRKETASPYKTFPVLSPPKLPARNTTVAQLPLKGKTVEAPAEIKYFQEPDLFSRKVNSDSRSVRDMVELIEEAIYNQWSLRIKYFTEGRGKSKQRVIQPFDLEQRGANYFCHAYCTWREEDRVFKVSNIEDIEVFED